MRSIKSYLFVALVVFFLAGIAVGRRIDRRIRHGYPRTPNPVTKDIRKVEMDLGYDFTVTGRTDRMKLLVLLPRSIAGRQKIESVSCSPQASRIINKNGNRYAEFHFFKPKKRFSVNIKVHADLYRYDLETARKKKGKYPVEEPDLSEFLIDERLIQKDDESIQASAKKINGRNRYETVKKVYDYVIDTLEYGGLFEEEFGAVQALSQKKGDCTEYSDLFVALCRAKGIPARVVTGYTIRFDSIPPKHHWAEVYFENLGWVPFDVNWGDSENPVSRNRGFDSMKTVYIYLSRVRNDKVLHNKHFYTFTYWGDKVDIKSTIKFKKDDQAKKPNRVRKPGRNSGGRKRVRNYE